MTEDKGLSHPFFKKGYKVEPGNYQPVSLTSVCSRIMEQILMEVMTKQMEDRKNIRDSQHGFNKGKLYLSNLVAFNDGPDRYRIGGWTIRKN